MPHLCFVVTGEYLTSQARDLVLEHEWRRGLELLVDGLDGMDHGTAIAVLSGAKRLEGENSLALVDEDPEVAVEHAAATAFLFAGTARTRRPSGGRVFLRPYAYVDHWGPHDILTSVIGKNVYAPRYIKAPGGVYPSKTARSVCYMDNPVNDFAVALRHPALGQYGCAVVLWAEAEGDPPPWLDVPAGEHGGSGGWDRALTGYLDAGGRLERRGHAWYEALHPEEAARQRRINEDRRALMAPAAVRSMAPPDAGQDLILELGMRAGLTPEAAAGMATVMAGPEPEGPPEPDLALGSAHAWVLPDGRFFPCQYFQHKQLALRLFMYLRGDAPADPDQEAGRLHWVKISSRAADGEPVVVACGDRTTEAQRDVVRRWAEHHGVPTRDIALLLEERDE